MESRSSKLIITLFAMTLPPVNCLFDVNIPRNFSISLHQALSMFIKLQFRIHPISETWRSFGMKISQPEIWLMYFIATHSSFQLHMRDTKRSPQGYSSVKELPLPVLCHDDSSWCSDNTLAMCWRAKEGLSPSVLGKRVLDYRLK